ncbi:MAG TPA: ClC family H(+)/Cl(-) exchange transporter [Lachnospiraceae bacterium]|nr:ClC family H(+)/Cl(-) exchange transporter [Lachnospiraceae bacterium]
MKNNFNSLTDDSSRNFLILLKSILVGTTAGLAAVIFRKTLTYAEKASFLLYEYIKDNKTLIPILVVGLCVAGYFIGYLVSKNSMISGSGVPQVKGIMLGYFKGRKSWFHTLILKFIGGSIAILGGLSLGREGPSIQIGASIGEGIGNKMAKDRMERKILIASGASAGLAAAFNAPLAGVIFALEEIFKYFSPTILLATMSAAVTADFISKTVFGLEPIFNFAISESIPLTSYGLLIILGFILGIMGAFYNYVLIKTQQCYQKSKMFSVKLRPMIPLLFAGVLGILFPVVLGGGHRILEELTPENGVKMLLLIFVIKFLFSMVSFGSGAPGGIFFPLLILGGTIGAIFAKIMIIYFGYDESFFNNFIILAMAGYFTAIVRAPITGIVLIMEMTGSFSHMLSLSIVVITANVVADLVRSQPIYDNLLRNLIEKEMPTENRESSRKIIVEMLVSHGSQLENKQVKMIKWPRKTLLVNVKRGEDEMLPKGETELKAGDYLHILTDCNNEWKTREKLEEMNAHL